MGVAIVSAMVLTAVWVTWGGGGRGERDYAWIWLVGSSSPVLPLFHFISESPIILGGRIAYP